MNAIQILLSNQYKKLSDLPNKFLLIDTNFLIDAVKYPIQFKELLEIFKDSGFTLVSIQATLIEFAKGSNIFHSNCVQALLLACLQSKFKP